jgi:hypothetical protein
MKNNLSDDLHNYVRSNEGASFRMYERLEIPGVAVLPEMRSKAVSVELKIPRQSNENFPITI